MEEYRHITYADSLSLEDADVLCDRFDVNKTFSYSCSLALCPEVTWKGDYRNMKVHPLSGRPWSLSSRLCPLRLMPFTPKPTFAPAHTELSIEALRTANLTSAASLLDITFHVHL